MKTATSYAIVAVLMICLIGSYAKPIADGICGAMDTVAVALGK